jgi:hypothetical protein
MAPAMSAAVQGRFISVRSTEARLRSSGHWLVHSVATKPGATALARAHSALKTRVNVLASARKDQTRPLRHHHDFSKMRIRAHVSLRRLGVLELEDAIDRQRKFAGRHGVP